MTSFLGCNPTATYAALADNPTAVGTRGEAGGKEYIFVKATTALAQFDAGFIDAAFNAAPVGTANDQGGGRVGIAQVAIALNNWGWVLVWGAGQVNCLTGALLNARLNTTGTAGALDDDATAGSFPISGLSLSATRGAGTGPAACVASYPGQGPSVL